MKLNMQMIANLLPGENLILNIDEKRKPVLSKVRRRQAADAAYIFQSGPDVILKAQDEEIIFKDENLKTALEKTQDAIDTYSQWFEDIVNVVQYAIDFQKVIDLTWPLIKNPMYFVDAELKLLGITNFYVDHEGLDPQWVHVMKTGYFSYEWIHYMHKYMSLNPIMILNNGEYYTDKNLFINNRYSKDLINHLNNSRYGFIEVLEFETKFNYGHFYLLDFLLEFLNTILETYLKKNVAELSEAYSSIGNILNNSYYDNNIIKHFLSERGWKENDSFIVVKAFFKDIEMSNKYSFVSYFNLIFKKELSEVLCFVYNEDIIIIINCGEYGRNDYIAAFEKISAEKGFCFGVSQLFCGFFRIRTYYKQAALAIEFGNYHDPANKIYKFETYAVSSLIGQNDWDLLINSCHPDIIRLEQYDKSHNSSYLATLVEYLHNERNLVQAAASLFIHRNTMIYRIEKILKMLSCDLKDANVREHMLLSYRILTHKRKP